MRHEDLDKTSEEPDIHRLSLYVEDVVTYIAGWIARSLQGNIKCMDCALSLTSLVPMQHHDDSLLSIKDNGGLITPSNAVRMICLHAERQFRQDEEIPLPKFMVSLLRSLPSPTDLFIDLRDHHLQTLSGIDSHLTSLVRLVALKYFNLRKHHVAKRCNLRIHARRMRSTFNHLLHYTFHQ